ncbi:MAG TPA: prepilin peptidase [Candidatus Angelobacter sp.]|nr:prepilin peptidase [Candidatus Angelobacter sp.]
MVFYIVAFFLFGLIFGSFLNVCIHRMPLGLSVVRPRSACPGCQTPIAAHDNIPVLSWVLLKGKCRHCLVRISPRYAVVELLTGGFFALSYYLTVTRFDATPSLPAAKYCVLSFLLIGLIFTDAETKLLPDLLTKPGIVLGLLFSLLIAVEGPAEFFLQSWVHHTVNWRLVSFINAFAGAALGSAFILAAALMYKAARGHEGMGLGDVKLMALIGAFLGVKLTLLVLLVGSLVGSIFGLALILVVWRKRLARRRSKVPAEPAKIARTRSWHSAILLYRNFQIPFGVFLGGAALFAAFWGHVAFRWYWELVW